MPAFQREDDSNVGSCPNPSSLCEESGKPFLLSLVKVKGVYVYLQVLSAKGWSPKGRRGKKNTFCLLTCEAKDGIRTLDLFVYSQML